MKFFRFWFPVLTYSGIIFWVSSLPSFATAADFSDKIAHVIEYSLLGYLSARALKGTTSLSKNVVWLAAVGFTFVYGLSDEFHQTFVPTRNAEWADVLADFVGGGIGSAFYFLRFKL